MYEIDDWRGTPPKPFPPRSNGLRDALIAVAIYNLASQISEGKLRDQIQTQVDHLYSSAGKNIAG